MSCQCAQMRIHQAWSRTQQTEGTYPEYDVETEDEILDAAAHFMSLEMLSGHHLDGFFFLKRRPYLEGITSIVLLCLTAWLWKHPFLSFKARQNAPSIVSASNNKHHPVFPQTKRRR